MENIKKDFFSIKNFNVITQTLNEYLIINNRRKLIKEDYIEIYNLMNKKFNGGKNIKTLNKIVILKYLEDHSKKKSENTFQYNDFQKINKKINEKSTDLKLKSEHEIINDLYVKQEEKVLEKKLLELKSENELVTTLDDVKPMYSNDGLKEYTLIDYIQSKPDEKFRRIDEKFLIIDSRERNSISTTESNSYRIKLDKPLKNVEEIELKSAEIPITKYNINDSNNSFTFNLGTSSYDITLPNGIYDVIDIESELGGLISDTLTADGITNNFLIDYDTVQSKFVFTNEILSEPNYTDNLIVWFPGSVDTINGATLTNLGISSYITATLQNSVVVTTTSVFDNRAFYFDGTDDSVILSTPVSFGTTDEYTVSMYVSINTTIFGDSFMFFAGNAASTNQGFVYRRGPGPDFNGDGNGERALISFRNNAGTYIDFIGYSNEEMEIVGADGTVIQTGVAQGDIPWLNGTIAHHAFVFKSNNDVDYYLNGNKISTVNAGTNQLLFNSFGDGYSSSSLSLTGYIDDVRIYDAALTASSISQIYQETAVDGGGDPSDYQFNFEFTSTTGIAKNLGFTSTSVTSSIYTDYPATSITRLNLSNTHALISDIPGTLTGDPFMVLDIKNLKAELVSNNEKFEQKFGKISLTNNLYGIEYFNQKKVKAKKIFNPPLASLDYLDIEFLDSNGELYDFNGHENSLTLNFKINEYQLPLHIESDELNIS